MPDILMSDILLLHSKQTALLLINLFYIFKSIIFNFIFHPNLYNNVHWKFILTLNFLFFLLFNTLETELKQFKKINLNFPMQLFYSSVIKRIIEIFLIIKYITLFSFGMYKVFIIFYVKIENISSAWKLSK